jgi:hypothetical protein
MLPGSDDEYGDMGKRLANKGYKYPPGFMLSLVRGMMRKDPPKRRGRTSQWKS